MVEIGDRIVASSGSIHEGQKGEIVGDYYRQWMVKVENEDYKLSYKAKGRDGRYIMVNKDGSIPIAK